MAKAHNLGFPSIGHRRELKKAVEGYWNGSLPIQELEEAGRRLRLKHWQIQQEAGLDYIPVFDFSYYDRMLDMTVLLGAMPKRFEFGADITLADYFAMARGVTRHETPVHAMEMTKWFDTNYHYIVPEFDAATSFRLIGKALFDQVQEAKSQGVPIKVVLIGPLTYLYLGKSKQEGFDRLSLLEKVLPVYADILRSLSQEGVEWVQMDEPALVMDLPAAWQAKLPEIYRQLSHVGPKLLLTTYFESVAPLADTLKSLPVDGIHLDLSRGAHQLDAFLTGYPADKVLSLGVVDGRNIWRNDLEQSLDILEKAGSVVGNRLWVAPSCSLLHTPVDLQQETKLDNELKSWMAFSVQKLEEIAALKKAIMEGRKSVQQALEQSRNSVKSRRMSPRIHNPEVQKRLQQLGPNADKRDNPFPLRQQTQQKRFHLPLFPTTTIGSFPQTQTIRRARADFKKGLISQTAYTEAMKNEIAHAIRKQTEMGLDVLVHGEAERNDMVEYFGEQLAGFAFSQYGWVQSYGSRCVKPPIIYGDVYRPHPMTVEWITYAQSLTDKPMKGMLTGPVTILQWSFYRDDQPRSQTALQIALAIRDEVRDLEKAGIGIIQIDEPAFREGLPLKRKDWDEYLAWAGKAFRISASGISDETQIHTHMCYSEFNDILPAIAAMDADVITIEASRSDLELLRGFAAFEYPNEIGPGVYDVHSPAIPTVEQMRRIIEEAAKVIKPRNLWVNPDCGLKTRAWEEVEPALNNMTQAAKQLRQTQTVAAAS